MTDIRRVRTEEDIRYQLSSGVNVDDWESDDIARLLSDLLETQVTLRAVLAGIPAIRSADVPHKLQLVREAKALIGYGLN